MTALLFTELQFCDNNGDPLANGKVYFYANDGTTPQNAYTSAAGNVALANPTILDAAGRPNNGGGIWLGVNLTYTIIVKDSNDATIMTLSGVSPNSAGIAPSSASYITATAESGLSAERVLTGTANQITVTDGGATATLSLPYQVNLGSSATGPSELRFFEDTDNGANKITVIAPASISSDVTLTLPVISGTLAIGTYTVSNLSGIGTYSVVASDITRTILTQTGTTIAVTLLAPATAGNGWFCYFVNRNSGDMTLTPASGNINGAASLTVATNTTCRVICDGSNYFSIPKTPS